ncbi:endopeptidase La [Nakamurella flavida]|uniref:Lon protease n=1 Tax=Nakamurella flavida TaxID=363630 RepID=A0A939C049_9ACTN|nr:endopeptidase La [Nakamurella flavida]MBM9476353.1 endopeptidase La [Nakamurella flavida]MDP9779547.1 ATP-dependent Lon protease [Nakamurella flavida]
MTDQITDTSPTPDTDTTLDLPVLSLADMVVLPGMVVPITLDDAARAAVDAAQAVTRTGEESSEHADTRADTAKPQVLLVPRLPDRYSAYGVLATVEQVGRTAGGEPAAVLRAGRRARLGAGVTGPGAALWVRAEPTTDQPADPEHTARARELAAEYKSLVVATLQKRDAWQVIDTVEKMTDPSVLADAAGWAPYLTDEQKRTLLETPDVIARLEQVIAWTRAHLAEMDVAEKISTDVREGMERSQREFLLRQQLAAIRKELGESDPEGSQDYRSRVEEADLPEHIRTAALREVDKLERSSEQNPETGWIRTWLDIVLDLPWQTRTTDSTDVTAARAVLDADHHGLDDVKDRIVEYLAVRSRRAERGLQLVGGRGSGAVLLLAGPPGVGKTSLGESVARALGRSFVRVALGGVRDEAEIRGHRRTYVGALPGRIVRAVTEAKTMNPVVLLDEIDKVGADGYRGDPAAALLEVLDPAQNHTFRDHYLDLDLDLSDVLFVATANVVENIPAALLDRLELITMDGYTQDDKVAIARTHLLPRQLERAALDASEVEITDAALHLMAADYTREAGVRQLERLLAKTLRKVALRLATDAGPVTVDEGDLKGLIGRPRFTPETAERTSVPGVATGLAVTGLGGDVLFIEASGSAGDAGLTLTGQLGDVMKESVQIALSYVRSHAGDLGVDPATLDRRIHLHVPAGAVPKDGPSAGVTMVTALVSLATGRPVRGDVAMTGEVTLNGKVLPIGGVKQKLLAAQRAGVSTVFIPARNAPDLDDVPAEMLAALDVRPVADVAEILALALESAAQQDAAPAVVAA